MANLSKKDDRVNLLNSFYTTLIQKGCKRETYKDINIFTRTLEHAQGTRYTLIVYCGTSTSPICNYYYLTEESRSKKITDLKAYQDRNEQRKNENKGKRALTGSALCAQAVREELKLKFPYCKFSVTSDNFSGGNAVRISWENGPTDEQVSNIVNRYEYGHFDGMTDMYESSNNIEGLPQAKFVSTRRTVNEELQNRILTEFEKIYITDEPEYSQHSAKNILRRILCKTEIKDVNNVKGIEENGQNGFLEDCYKLTFVNEEQPTVKAEVSPTIKPLESVQGVVNIIEYSEKAIAVIGDTKPIKDLLKNLGGSFNPRLTCGAGWIFSKKKLEEVQTALINNAKKEEPQTTQEENTNLPVIYTKPQTTLKDEIKQTVLFFAEQDIKNTGEVSQQTKEIAKIQDVEIIKETPTGKALNLEYFKILWHEGHQTPNFNDAVFTDWQEVQNAFYQLWERNEKGQDGGYTKVKCEIKFKGEEALTDRIDITNRTNNGDFNPSEIHILQYLKETILEEGEEITEPAQGGKMISLFNLSQIINNKTINV